MTRSSSGSPCPTARPWSGDPTAGRSSKWSQSPDPPPVTTIGWRLAHIAASNIGTRANAFFGPDPIPEGVTLTDPRFTPPIPAPAGAAVALLHEVWQLWKEGFAGLGDAHPGAHRTCWRLVRRRHGVHFLTAYVSGV